MLTLHEQKLLVSMLDKPCTSKTQKVYLSRACFYKAIWKLRDAGLVRGKVVEQSDKKIKVWSLTLDGILLARILKKA